MMEKFGWFSWTRVDPLLLDGPRLGGKEPQLTDTQEAPSMRQWAEAEARELQLAGKQETPLEDTGRPSGSQPPGCRQDSPARYHSNVKPSGKSMWVAGI